MYVNILPQRFLWCIVILCDRNPVKMHALHFSISRMAGTTLPSVTFQLFLLKTAIFYFVVYVPLVLRSRCSVNILLNRILPALVWSDLLMPNLHHHYSGHRSEKLEYKWKEPRIFLIECVQWTTWEDLLYFLDASG